MSDKKVFLKDLVENVKQKMTSKKDTNKPYIGLEHLPSSGANLIDIGTASDSISSNNIFENGDILFGKLRPRLRKCLQVNFNGYCSTDILVLRAYPFVCSKYAGKILQSDFVFTEAIRTEEGTKMPRTSWRSIKEIEVFSPPLPQQRKIARILTAIDNLIEKTEALIAKYQSIKQGLMHDLFTRGVDANGKLRPPQAEVPELYKQSELGWIPKEWEVKQTRDIADVKGGKRLPVGQPFADSPTQFPYIRVSDMHDWSVDDSAIEYVPEWIEPIIRNYKISYHDLYISIAGTLGLVGMVPEELDKALLSENAAKIVFKNSEIQSKEYLTAFFNSPLFLQQLEESKGIGAGVPKLALHRIERFLLPLPRLAEQEKISNVLMECRNNISNEKYYLKKSLFIKTALMQDLLTGKVQVTPDAVDMEPAHE